MRVLLKEDVEHLGSVGDEIEVKDGFARNYLLPRGKALLATPKNVKAYAHQKMVVQKRLKKMKAGAQEVADRIAGLTCAVKKKVGAQGKLFGSVTNHELADWLHGQGVDLDRRKIQMSEPIKKLGEFQVPVKLHPEVVAQLKVVVEPEEPAADEGTAEEQAPATAEGPTDAPPAEATEESAS